MDVKFNWINEAAQGCGRSVRDAVVVTKNKGGILNGERRYSAAIILPVETMRAARFVIGDRILIGVANDPDVGRCLAIKRVIKGGHRIGPASGSVHGCKDGGAGQCLRGRVQMAWTDSMHDNFEAPKKNLKILEDGTLIVWEGLTG